jgi:peroxiredoxin
MRARYDTLRQALIIVAVGLSATLLLQSCVRKSSATDSQATHSASPSILPADLTDQLKQAGFAVAAKPFVPHDFTLEALDGSRQSLSSFKGKVVFLSFWATWCSPCNEELPSIQSLYSRLSGKGLVVVAIDMGEDKTRVKKFAREHGLSFPVLLDTDVAVGSAFDASSIPTNYLLDRSGRIIARIVGYDGTEWTTKKRLELFDRILQM